MAIEDIKQTHRDIASVMDDDYVFKNSNNGKIFNEFNKTGGDITKLEGYNILSETIKTLRRLLHGQKQAVYSEFSDTIKEAHELLLNNVEFFKNAFKENRDTVKLAYGTIASTLSLIVTNACSAILDRFEEHGTELDNTILVNKFKEITKLEIYKNLKEMIKIINNMELKKIVDKNIDKEIEGLKKINKDFSPELSTRLKYMITSVEGNRDTKSIREFVDNYLLAKDSRALREYVKATQPDVDLTFTTNSGTEVAIPIGINFFWPDVE